MKILLASDFFPPSSGGLEAHVQRLANALIRREHEVAVVTCTAQPDPLPGSTAMLSAMTVLGRAPQLFREGGRPYPPPFPDASFRRTVSLLADRWQPDVIHAHGWCAFSCYWPSAPPLVVTLHDHGLRCPKKTLIRDGAECVSGRGMRCVTCAGAQSIPRLAAHTSRFLAVSRSVAQRVAEVGITAPAVEVVPNFLDIDDLPSDAPADAATILFVGPDSQHKGRSVLINAFRHLPSGQARLVLVGSDTPVNVPGVSTVGYLQNAALREQYQKASVVVVPSVWPEPCPTVVLEAMAHSRPVVGSRIGGIPDLVEDGLSGLLVRPSDPRALADALLRILTDHDLRHRLAMGARARAEQFSTDAVVPRIEKVYASVLGDDLTA
jgi:glycosyltransferase involved in cell wall biosynthesis